MVRSLLKASILIALPILTGCSGIAYRSDPVITYSQLDSLNNQGHNNTNEKYQLGPINLDTYKFPDRPKELAIVLASGDAGFRNRLQSAILLRSDQICDVDQSQILGWSNNSNLATGFISSLFSGAAAVVTGNTLKSALSATAGVSTATRSLISEEVYRGKFVQVILDIMNRSRQDKAAIIKTKNKEPITEYPVEEAIRDAIDYHKLCSFHNGITLLSLAVDRKTPCDQLRAQRKAIMEDIKTYSELGGAKEKPEEASKETKPTAAGAPAGSGSSVNVPSGPKKDIQAPKPSADKDKNAEYINDILKDKWKLLKDVESKLSGCLTQ